MSFMGDIKCLSSESSPPDPPGKDVLRIYSVRFSPYTERVKLVLHAKGIEHETVNVDLANKPSWLKDKNPQEMLPIVEINDRILHESTVISNYLDVNFPGRQLLAEEPFQRTLQAMALEKFSPVLSGYFRYIFGADDAARKENWSKLETGVATLIPFLENGNPFICGEKPGMTDYMVWPFLERIGLDAMSLISEQPLLQGYFDRMGKDESVIACRVSGNMLKEFHDLYRVGKKEWDYGLE